MDSPDVNIPPLVFAIFALVGFLSACVYAWMGACVAKNGGRVNVEKFGLPDFIAGGVLIALLVLVAVTNFQAPQREIHDSDLINSAMLDIIIVTSICSFLYFRGINLVTLFGLRTVRLDKVAGFAFLFLFAAYPLTLWAAALAKHYLPPDAKPQDLVKSFMEATQHMNDRTMFLTFFTGLVIAPIAEEFIFRGYIHGIMKRRFGIAAGLVFNAALFAAVHANALSLLPLFTLAVCLTLAYEFTGSILVNMGMHSLFNFTQFYLMLSLAGSHPK